MPDCGSKESPEAHHIIPYGDNKALAWRVSNGITLCKKCHMKVDKDEAAYVELFQKIVAEKSKRNPSLLLMFKRQNKIED